VSDSRGRDDVGSILSGAPRGAVLVPPSLEHVVGTATCRCVWQNGLGGLTFELAGDPRRFVKWSPVTSGLELEPEVVRLAWLADRVPVPRVLDHGRDGSGSWMVTAALPGENAVAPRWKAAPQVAVREIGRGLRAFHDALPISSCPFSWSAAERAADARHRAAAGRLSAAAWHPSHRHLSAADALALVAHAPDADRLVVCHGDACAPNTLLDSDGSWSGHVDLGAVGVADRWADLAIATWSTQWNYGPGWEALLLDAYGIELDVRRTAYYRLLWDLGP